MIRTPSHPHHYAWHQPTCAPDKQGLPEDTPHMHATPQPLPSHCVTPIALPSVGPSSPTPRPPSSASLSAGGLCRTLPCHQNMAPTSALKRRLSLSCCPSSNHRFRGDGAPVPDSHCHCQAAQATQEPAAVTTTILRRCRSLGSFAMRGGRAQQAVGRASSQHTGTPCPMCCGPPVTQ